MIALRRPRRFAEKVALGLALFLVAFTPSSLVSQERGGRPRSRMDPLFEAIADERVALVRRRLPAAARINDVDTTSGCTPLTWALVAGQPQSASRLAIIRMLLDRGADPNLPDASANTPMEKAVRYPWPEVVRLLIARGGNPRVPARVGGTTLLYSVCDGGAEPWPGIEGQRLETARILLDAGLDPTEMSDWAEEHDFTVVDQCIQYDLPEVARLFASRGARPRTTLRHPNPRRAELARELADTPLAP